jgi:hypothetical protein
VLVPKVAEESIAGPPDRAVRRALLHLAAIVAPAVWAVPVAGMRLAAGPPHYDFGDNSPSVAGFVALTLLAALPVLIGLVTVFGVLAKPRLPVSLARTAAQLGVLYLSAMAVMLFDPPLSTLPGAAALGLAAFVAPPLLTGLLLRWFRWRLVRSQRLDANEPAGPRFQFRLADVFVWMTLIAAYLGMGTGLLAWFNKVPSGWEGLGPAILVMFCFILCVPTGLISVILTWLILVVQRRLARLVVAIGLAVLWVGYSAYVLSEGHNGPDMYSLLIIPPVLALPALVLLGLARAAGWRMQRLPRRGA